MTSPNEIDDSALATSAQQADIDTFYRALQFGVRSEVAAVIHKTNGDVVRHSDYQGNTAMHWAAKCGDVSILELLHKHGAALNNATEADSRMKPIHWAASDGKTSSLAYLLNKGVDINTVDGAGCTALLIAVQHNQIQAAIFLIHHHADATAVDANGDSITHWAAYKGHAEMLGYCIYVLPNTINATDNYGQTPLHLASLRGNLDCVQYLTLDCQASTTIKDRSGVTALELASKKQQFTVEWFLHFTSKTFLSAIMSVDKKKLLSTRGMRMLLCGVDSNGAGIWAWRIVFASNLVGTIVSAYLATDERLADLYMIHFISMLLAGVWWFSFIMCLFVPPGYVVEPVTATTPTTMTPYAQALEVIGQYSGDTPSCLPVVCHSCHVRRPLRSKHCRNVRRCVHRFDHHCPFVGNTLGRDNYRYFVLLIFTHMVLSLLFQLTAIISIWRGPSTWLFIFFCLYLLMWMGAIFSLVYYHSGLLVNNMTTNEHMGVSKYSYFRNRHNNFDNPFSKGNAWDNIIDSIFPSNEIYYTREEVTGEPPLSVDLPDEELHMTETSRLIA